MSPAEHRAVKTLLEKALDAFRPYSASARLPEETRARLAVAAAIRQLNEASKQRKVAAK